MINMVSPDKPTIIIPAYNEAKVIKKNLTALRPDGEPYYQLIISCNGCTDNTAAIARESIPEAFILETPVASKATAIRQAEALNPGFPRVYMDADVHLNEQDLITLIKLVEKSAHATLVAPKSITITKGSNYCVRAFYREWYRSVFVQRAGYGAGIYSLNKKARVQFDEWPELFADDKFVRNLFNGEQFHLAKYIVSVVQAPLTLKQLIRIKTRTKLGNLQLQHYLQTHKIPLAEDSPKHQSSLSLDFLIYSLVNLIAYIKARKMFKHGKLQWLRDQSSH